MPGFTLRLPGDATGAGALDAPRRRDQASSVV